MTIKSLGHFKRKTNHWLISALLFASLFSYYPLSYGKVYVLRSHRGCLLQTTSQLYCFNFNKLDCTTLAETPDCDPKLIFPNQASCLAIIYQNESYPICLKSLRIRYIK